MFKFSTRSKSKKINVPNINTEQNYIFIHIPKNAGTSIYKTLGMKSASHRTANEYSELLGDSYSRFFKFCFVRNPFERFISLYNYARMDESYHHSALDPSKASYGKHLDYDILKNASVDEAVDLLIEGKLKSWDGGKQWYPQSYWVLDNNNKISVDYIGRVENIYLDFRNICNILKSDSFHKLAHLNRSVKDAVSYKTLINDQARKKLEHYYKTDLELFGYAFDLENKYYIRK